jgi:hypothetical protein
MSKRKAIPKRLRFATLERDGFRCRYCGADARHAKLHIDHVTPVSAGGDNDPENLVTACEDCNLGKAALELKPRLPRAFEFALAGLIFGRAVEKFALQMRADDYQMIEDLCLAELEPQKFARALEDSASWGEARHRFYTLAEYPVENNGVVH